MLVHCEQKRKNKKRIRREQEKTTTHRIPMDIEHTEMICMLSCDSGSIHCAFCGWVAWHTTHKSPQWFLHVSHSVLTILLIASKDTWDHTKPKPEREKKNNQQINNNTILCIQWNLFAVQVNSIILHQCSMGAFYTLMWYLYYRQIISCQTC